jgi:CRP/FNR family transcriptional regulator/CRP/FNR family cyclic AMP-dependent transcriptional regulator
MYVICEGRVQVSKLSDDGREKILEFFEKGAFFGEMSLLDDAPRSASVRALTDTRILALSRSDFLAVMRRSPDVAMAVGPGARARLRSTDPARELALVPAREGAHPGSAPAAGQGRVRQERPPDHAVVTHQQIADMVGTSRETVTRALKGLKQEGWLAQEGKRYVVPVCESAAARRLERAAEPRALRPHAAARITSAAMGVADADLRRRSGSTRPRGLRRRRAGSL